MHVLITNLFLAGHSGTETVAAITASGLRRAGHQVSLFAPQVGDLAQSLRAQGFALNDRIVAITTAPDVIHAHHLTPTLIAMARFPGVPVVFTCHSSFFTIEAPMLHPQIARYVAVDEACRQKSLACGIAESRLSTILNAVDLSRFLRRAPLPERPLRALLLTKNHAHQQLVREACQAASIALDELGPATGRLSSAIETELPHYDLVFATARMAIEAASVGCAVVVCDARGFAGLLTSSNMEHWRQYNLGVGLLAEPLTRDNLDRAIAAYDARDVQLVTDYFRATAGLDDYIAGYVQLYQQAIDEFAPAEAEAMALANAQWIEELAVTIPERKWFTIASELGMQHRQDGQAAMLARLDALAQQLQGQGQQALSQMLAQLDQQIARQQDQLALQHRTTADLQSISGRLDSIDTTTRQAASLYRALVPAFIRRFLFNRRQRR